MIADAVVDSLKMAPFLFIVFLVLELLEHRFGSGAERRWRLGGAGGPAVAALLGCVPQCGFSAVGSALYARRAIPLGTLLAVYLSTSDEAVPVLMSRPGTLRWLAPLILVKLVVAISIGTLLNLMRGRTEHAPEPLREACGHDHAGCAEPRRHPALCAAVRTAQVLVFVVVASIALNALVSSLGAEGMKRALLHGSILQPAIVGLVGLAPNCAASVAVTQAFVDGGIGFGGAVAGLCAAAGSGLLVLFRENRPLMSTVRVVILLYASSVLAGVAIQAVWG